MKEREIPDSSRPNPSIKDPPRARQSTPRKPQPPSQLTKTPTPRLEIIQNSLESEPWEQIPDQSNKRGSTKPWEMPLWIIRAGDCVAEKEPIDLP